MSMSASFESHAACVQLFFVVTRLAALVLHSYVTNLDVSHVLVNKASLFQLLLLAVHCCLPLSVVLKLQSVSKMSELASEL